MRLSDDSSEFFQKEKAAIITKVSELIVVRKENFMPYGLELINLFSKFPF